MPMRRKTIFWIATVAAHLLGVATVFFLTFWMHGSEEVARTMGEAWGYGLFEQNRLELAIHVGLSASLWALLVIAFKLVSHALRKEKRVNRLVLAKRGTVMTETLIVIGPLLLLTLGLLQLTLNSTAGLFTSLAAFQAGRTVYVWDPETDGTWGRNGGQSKAEVAERARIAAASVLAPVTPSDYATTCSTSGRFDKKLEAMMSATLGAAGTFGATSAAGVRALAAGKKLAFQSELTVTQAYDTDSFAMRGPIKMFMAYCHTGVDYRNDGENNIIAVAYDHRQVMPLVGPIFGQVKGTGRFSTVERSFTMPRQLHPNPTPPTSIFSILNFNPFKSWE